jgi:CBS domain-containing protein
MKRPNESPEATAAKRIVTRPVTLEPDGEQLGPFTVCPRKLRVVPVEQCRHCEDFAGLCINPESRAPFLRCAFDDAPFVHAPAGAAEPNPAPWLEAVRVRDLMTLPAEHATLDTRIDELLSDALKRAEALAVIDAEGRALGIITCSDLLQRLHDRSSDERKRGALEPEPTLTLRDIRLSPSFMVSADAPLGHVSAVMAYEHVQHVLVVDQEQRLEGIVSALDIARWLACRSGYVVPG